MSTRKKIKTDNNNKILQDVIDFEILKSIINYLLNSKKNKTINNNNNNQYNINKFYLNRNEILNYILVSKKWYNFISLTISNNIIDNKLFEHWLKINYDDNKSFIENYNNQNQYDKNNLIFNNQNKINFNKEFTIIKIQESIINDYFKFNLFLNQITIDDFKEIKNKFENNQLVYKRIVVNVEYDNDGFPDDSALFPIHEYVSNQNPETISNLFKILELNFGLTIEGYQPESVESNKKCTELLLNNLSITGVDTQVGEDDETVKIFQIFKGKNLIYDGSDVESDSPTHVNYSALFDPDNSGQQVESIKVQCNLGNCEFVEARHLIKVNQFDNLHSISIPIVPFQILSNLSEEMGFTSFYSNSTDSGISENMKSELNQMINSFITCKSLKNLKISSTAQHESYLDTGDYDDDLKTFANNINEVKESYSNSFKPLFSESNTSIERIELDCCCQLNIDTFSNLLNNKSIKYLYLYDSDFIVYSLKQTDNGRAGRAGRGVRGRGGHGGGRGDGDDDDDDAVDDNGDDDNDGDDDEGGDDDDEGGDDEEGGEIIKEPISINQYLFENIFSSPLTSIRHYRIKFIESKELKLIFNLILNNIFKLQLYSLIFEFNENELVGEFVKEFKNLINNISTQQQEPNNINLKEIKIKINDKEYIQELNNINNPYFTTVIKK
ncbi:hypothetical protein ACTFIW_011004 [Dictyostelium discoideum]